MVMDRRSRAIAPGSLALLTAADKAPLGLVAANPGSKIAARMLDPDPGADVDAAWLTDRLTRALTLRETLFDAPFYRLVHAEADGLPGVVIDRFGAAAVIQPNAAWADVMADELAAVLARLTGCQTVLKNASGRTRSLEGLDDADAVLLGRAPAAPVPVPMNEASYMADLTGGQKTGLFFDQRPNHALVQRLSKGANVLDVFSHVGGFSLAALAARSSPSRRGRTYASCSPRSSWSSSAAWAPSRAPRWGRS